jgi:Aspartyl protease
VRVRTILGLLCVGILAYVPARAGNCRPTSEDCADAGSARKILPVKIYRDFVVVAEGQFGSILEHQNFMLDTGTAPTIINANVVERLGLTTGPATLTALGEDLKTRTSTIPELELGPIRAVSVAVQVVSLSRLERELGIPLAGIIGLDVLSKASFRLDYENKQIEFGDVSHQGIPAPFDARAGIAVVSATLGSRPVRMLVDTGSDRVVLLGGNFRDAGWLRLREIPRSRATSTDLVTHMHEFSADDILLGGQHFSKDNAYFIPDTADQQFDGLLGVRALGFRAVSYDRTQQMIYLQK